MILWATSESKTKVGWLQCRYLTSKLATLYTRLRRAAGHVEELVLAVKELGLDAIALTDHDTRPASPAASPASRRLASGWLIVGCQLTLRADLPNQSRRLCRLPTLGKGRSGKNQPILFVLQLHRK